MDGCCWLILCVPWHSWVALGCFYGCKLLARRIYFCSWEQVDCEIRISHHHGYQLTLPQHIHSSKPLKSGRALILWYIGYPTKFRHAKTDVMNRLCEMHTKQVSFPTSRELTFVTLGHRSLHVPLYLFHISCGLNNPFATGLPLSQKTVTFPSFPGKSLLKLYLLDLRLTLYTSNLFYDAVCASSYAFSQQSLTEWNKEMSNVALVSVSSYAMRSSLRVSHFKHTFNTSFMLAVLLESKSAQFCFASIGCLSKIWKISDALYHLAAEGQSGLWEADIEQCLLMQIGTGLSWLQFLVIRHLF